VENYLNNIVCKEFPSLCKQSSCLHQNHFNKITFPIIVIPLNFANRKKSKQKLLSSSLLKQNRTKIKWRESEGNNKFGNTDMKCWKKNYIN